MNSLWIDRPVWLWEGRSGGGDQNRPEQAPLVESDVREEWAHVAGDRVQWADGGGGPQATGEQLGVRGEQGRGLADEDFVPGGASAARREQLAAAECGVRSVFWRALAGRVEDAGAGESAGRRGQEGVDALA